MSVPTRHDLHQWWHEGLHIWHATTFRWPLVLLALLVIPAHADRVRRA